jgi:hypothetical protein
MLPIFLHYISLFDDIHILLHAPSVLSLGMPMVVSILYQYLEVLFPEVFQKRSKVIRDPSQSFKLGLQVWIASITHH